MILLYFPQDSKNAQNRQRQDERRYRAAVDRSARFC